MSQCEAVTSTGKFWRCQKPAKWKLIDGRVMCTKHIPPTSFRRPIEAQGPDKLFQAKLNRIIAAIGGLDEQS